MCAMESYWILSFCHDETDVPSPLVAEFRQYNAFYASHE